jgi:hypothetical protein
LDEGRLFDVGDFGREKDCCRENELLKGNFWRKISEGGK